MTLLHIRSAAILTLGLALTGCSLKGAQTAPVPDAATLWPAALTQAAQEVQARRYAAADRVLLEFQLAHPYTAEAADAAYHRALYKLDPANEVASLHDAAVVLDSMLALPTPSPRRSEVLVLRRVATSLETLAHAPPPVPAPAAAAPARAEELKAKDDEIARLRDDLSKANAELARVKRRVAKP